MDARSFLECCNAIPVHPSPLSDLGSRGHASRVSLSGRFLAKAVRKLYKSESTETAFKLIFHDGQDAHYYLDQHPRAKLGSEHVHLNHETVLAVRKQDVAPRRSNRARKQPMVVDGGSVRR